MWNELPIPVAWSAASTLVTLAAFKPEVLRAMARLFVESIFGLY